MRKFALIFISCIVLLALSCSKKSESSGSNTPFSYKSLDVSDTTMVVNGLVTATANASGDGLTYHWTASFGSFIGSGPSVKWTVCHADKFIITCVVEDANGNSDKKQRRIYVHD